MPTYQIPYGEFINFSVKSFTGLLADGVTAAPLGSLTFTLSSADYQQNCYVGSYGGETVGFVPRATLPGNGAQTNVNVTVGATSANGGQLPTQTIQLQFFGQPAPPQAASFTIPSPNTPPTGSGSGEPNDPGTPSVTVTC